MGYTLTPIAFIDIETPIKEVISCSEPEAFNAKSMKEFAVYRGSTSYKNNDKNHLVLEYWKMIIKNLLSF